MNPQLTQLLVGGHLVYRRDREETLGWSPDLNVCWFELSRSQKDRSECIDLMSEFSRLTNVHEGLAVPRDSVEAAVVKGTYEFYHYLCDGVDDRVLFFKICHMIYLIYMSIF